MKQVFDEGCLAMPPSDDANRSLIVAVTQDTGHYIAQNLGHSTAFMPILS